MKDFFKKYFVPHDGNDHHPHILREFFIFIFLFGAFLAFANSAFLNRFVAQSDFLASIYSGAIVNLANADRESNNLSTLTTNDLLNKAAQLKAEDMASKGYFAHTSPEGVAPWYWFALAGYDFLYAGENLAIDFNDSKDVETAWMNSPLHRANILNGHFTDIGIGIASGKYQGRDTTFVVEMFGSKKIAVRNENNKNFASVSKIVVLDKPSVEIAKATSQSQNFIEVKNVKGEFVEQTTDTVESNKNQASLSFFEKLVTNPKRVAFSLYALIAFIIVFSLLFFLGVAKKPEHHKSLLYALLFFIIILSVLYLTKNGVVPLVEVV